MPSNDDGGLTEKAVRSIVTDTLWSMLFGGVSAALVLVVTTYRRVQREIRGTLAMVGADVQGAFAQAGNAVIRVNFALEQMFVDIGLSGGVAAPIAVTTSVVISMLIVAALASAAWVLIWLIIPP